MFVRTRFCMFAVAETVAETAGDNKTPSDMVRCRRMLSWSLATASSSIVCNVRESVDKVVSYNEQHVAIRFLWAKGLNANESHSEMAACWNKII